MEHDEFCPCGDKWTKVNATNHFSTYYYCQKCDKIFVPTFKEVKQQYFDKNYSSGKRQFLVDLAKFFDAKSKVTKEDLKKLGYL
jgi:hypothetical protein